jgi:LacI family transcriptional regulator
MGDIAKKAGVSRATVSYVLNQRHQDRLQPETQQRVLEAAEALGYRPNLAARSLKNRKTHMVGVLVQNEPHNRLTHPLTWAFVLGINDGLAHSGYTMSLVRLTDVVEDGGLSSPVFTGHLLDGMLVVNQIPQDLEERVEELVPQCVWVDSNIWRAERCIRRDEVHAGKTAMQALATLDYRRVICLTGERHAVPHYSYDQRLQGVREAAAEYSIAVEEQLFPTVQPFPDISHHVQADWAALQQFINSLTSDDAVLMTTIYSAHSLLEACAMMGKVPGRDFGVACCDDGFQGAGTDWMHLSRVAFDRYEMGVRAARMMLQVLDNPLSPVPSIVSRGKWLAGGTALSREMSSGRSNFGATPVMGWSAPSTENTSDTFTEIGKREPAREVT